MRKLLLIAIVIGAGFIGWNHFVNVEPASAADREVANLEERFESAKRRMTQAGRSAAAGGIDTTAEMEAARIESEKIEKDLRKVLERNPEGETAKKAKRLEQAVRQFRNQFD